MARKSMTGVEGLHFINDRYRIDISVRDLRTGSLRRFTEMLPQGISLKAAKERAREANNLAHSGELFEAKERARHRLYECLDIYQEWSARNHPKTARSRLSVTNAIKRALPDKCLNDMQMADFETLKRVRQSEGAQAGTVNRAVAQLKHFIGRAALEGWISNDLAISLRKVTPLEEPPGRTRHLSDEEYCLLVNSLPKEACRFVITALLTGLRRGELVSLRKVDVDFVRKRIYVANSKNGRSRYVPMHSDVEEVLREAVADSSHDCVFVNDHGMPMTRSRITYLFRNAVKKAGLTNLRLHDCRHDFCTSLGDNQVDVNLIAKLAGHSTLAMAQRYTHIGDRVLAAAVQRIPTKGRPIPSCDGISIPFTQAPPAL